MEPAGRNTAVRGDLRGLILAALAGALVLLHLPALPHVGWMLAGVLIVLLPSIVRPLAVSFVFGFVWAALAANTQLEHRWPIARHGEQLAFEAVVEPFAESTGNGLRLIVRPLDAALPDRIRLTAYQRLMEGLPTAGQCLLVDVRMRAPTGRLNPGLFDYEAWLFREGLGAVGTLQAVDSCSSDANPIRDRYFRWRQHWRDQLIERLPASDAAALVRALLFADRSALSAGQWQVFRDSGTAHLMAISGLHIGFVALAAFLLGLSLGRLLNFFSPRLGAAPRWGWICSVSAATGYAALAGFSVPTLRALTMLLVLAAAQLSGWRLRGSQALAIAALIVFLLWPLSVLSAGFWMSFAAVAVIFWFMGGQRLNRWQSWFWLQPVLALGLLPLSLWLFGGSSVLAPLANWLAVPAMSVLLPLLMLAALAQLLHLPLSDPLMNGSLWALQCLQSALAAAVERFPLPWLHLGLGAWSLLALLAAVLLLLRPMGLPRWPLAGLLAVAALWPTPDLPDGQAELTVLDVGQGSAAVLRTRSHRLLIDAGPAYPSGFDSGEMLVVPFLRQQGGGLDQILVSHGDHDHSGGLPAVRKAYPQADVLGDEEHPCRAGQSWQWDAVQFEILHPSGSAAWRGNNRSCVLRVSGNGWSLLLPGDIEAAAEHALLQGSPPGRLQADVLLAPHHGSRTSSTEAWLQAVAPKLVLISAGWQHHYGHPHAEVLQRYAQQDAAWRSTAEHGALSLRLSDGPWQLQPARSERRIWRRAPLETTEVSLPMQYELD